jgi:hypothetical protein
MAQKDSVTTMPVAARRENPLLLRKIIGSEIPFMTPAVPNAVSLQREERVVAGIIAFLKPRPDAEV